MRRVLLRLAAVAIPISVVTIGVVGVGGNAWASSPVSCAKVSGSLAGTVHFKGCATPLANGNAVGTSLATGGTLSWKGKHPGSVSLSGSVTSPGQGVCPAGSKEYDASDVVTSITGSAGAVLQDGDNLSAQACVTKAGALKVVKYSITK
jgi:hypothetical protein